MPINDYVNMAKLLEGISFTGSSGTPALNPLVFGDTSTMLADKNGNNNNAPVQPPIDVGTLHGNPSLENLSKFLYRPDDNPNQPQVFNLSPDVLSTGGGNIASISPQLSGNSGVDAIGQLINSLVSGSGGSESGRGGYPSSGGSDSSGLGSQLGGVGGSLLGYGLSALFPELAIASKLPIVGSTIGKVFGSVFGGSKDRDIQVGALEIPENLAQFNIPSTSIDASTYGHARERIEPAINALNEARASIGGLYGGIGFGAPVELHNPDLPHDAAGRGEASTFQGLQDLNQQSVAVLSAAMSIYEILATEDKTPEQEEFANVYMQNPSIKALYQMSLGGN